MNGSPFPGMDPFLEDAEHWRGFHNLLGSEIVRRLNRLIAPKYYADLEVHVVLAEVGMRNRRSIYPDVGLFDTEPTAPPPAPESQPGADTTIEAPVVRAVETEPPEARNKH